MMAMMILVVPVNPVAAVVVRSPAVVAIIRRPPVITVITTWVITVIPRIPVRAIPVCRITDADSDSSDPD